jgi:Skp family chaperone for outer membrane proteins
MTRYRVCLAALVLLVGAVALLARPGSTAAGKTSAVLPVGFVDIDEVMDKSATGQAAKKQAQILRTQLEASLTKKQQIALLTAEQRTELEKLQAKAENQKSDTDKARIAELTAAGDALEKELLSLQQKASPTDAEKAKIEDLTKKMLSARQQLENDQQDAQKQLNDQGAKIMGDLQDKIYKAVEDVAKDRGLAIVVHKEARLFGGEDITDAVINKLKK